MLKTDFLAVAVLRHLEEAEAERSQTIATALKQTGQWPAGLADEELAYVLDQLEIRGLVEARGDDVYYLREEGKKFLARTAR